MNSTAKSALPPSHVNLGPLEDSLEFFIGRANTILLRAWALRWDDTGLRPRYFNALALVGANPGISLIEVARLLTMDKSGASELIDTMEGAGLVARKQSCTDQRRHGIYLTPAGVHDLAEIHREVRQHAQQVNEIYSEEERQQLIELLRRLPTVI